MSVPLAMFHAMECDQYKVKLIISHLVVATYFIVVFVIVFVRVEINVKNQSKICISAGFEPRSLIFLASLSHFTSLSYSFW